MYKELTIKNIKIFKEEQKLKIAPITLLYGENSSGKTTLLKTFDIIHNIFFESFVKRGKNVGQKDNPFYRNETIQNISAKKIHFYSNQLNNKPIKIEVKIDLPFDLSSEQLASIFTGIQKKNMIVRNTPLFMAGGLVSMEKSEEQKKLLVVPISMAMEIKYYPKEEISRVKNIVIKRDDGKSIIRLSREEKKYKRLDQIWDNNKVGYLPPSFNKTLVRPNRFSSAYNRGRPVAEKDYFVDNALYADYKIEIKNNFVWKDCYQDYRKIFLKDKETSNKLIKFNTYIEIINKFKELQLDSYNKKSVKAEYKYFSYFVAKFIFSKKINNINEIETKKKDCLKKIYVKSWSEKIKKLYEKDYKNYLNLSFGEVDGSKKLYEIDLEIKSRNKKSYNKMRDYLFFTALSKAESTNHYILKSFLASKKPVSFSKFAKFAKIDIEGLFRVRFYKRQDLDIKHELIRENGKQSTSTFDLLQIMSQYIYGGLDKIFNESPTVFGAKFSLPLFKDTLMNPGLLKKVLKEIRETVNNYVICHPSKTNVPWNVPNKTDFPENFLDKTLHEIVKTEKKSANLIIRDELDRRKNEREHFIDPKLIRSDGANFHTALISERGKNHTINKKFKNKLNKILKEVLNLELIVVSPEFLEKIFKDPEQLAAFKIAHRRGFAYPTTSTLSPLGSRRSSRTKFIMLRDLRFKKKFHIHGEEVGKGPTNILPFLAQLLSEKPNLVYVIQELENNWHPKYQAKIIDLIAKRMLMSKNKNFILETHSELFILQIKKLVQRGILKPIDVSINFISRTKDGNSKITNIPLNDIGGFEKEWPGGFFTERMDVLTS